MKPSGKSLRFIAKGKNFRCFSIWLSIL